MIIKAIKLGGEPGGFFSAHNYDISHGHTSDSCRKQGEGHAKLATSDNPAGLGAKLKKGWENEIT